MVALGKRADAAQKCHVGNLACRLTGFLLDRLGQRLRREDTAGVVVGCQERVEAVGVGARVDQNRLDTGFVDFVGVLDEGDLALDVRFGIGAGKLQRFESELLLRGLPAGDTGLLVVGIHRLDDEHELEVRQRSTGGQSGVCDRRPAGGGKCAECGAEADEAGAVKSPIRSVMCVLQNEG